MHSDVAISVENLTKTFRVFGHPGDRIKQALTLGRKRFHGEFTALRNVSFEVQKGESIGIIGRNGSGKSTLLQLICGILKPTSGSVRVNGRVCALLELGSGFNPEFTGRENVYFQGAIIGAAREEMDAKLERILAFADIGGFIDEPVRTYSSGMFVRLAFAVIANLDADILVIDEALAVGDVFFQQKCMRYLRSFQAGGGTILFVSHDTATVVGLCQRAFLLGDAESGVAIGTAKEICQLYVRDLYATRSKVEGLEFRVGASAAAGGQKTCDRRHEVDHPSRHVAGENRPTNTIELAPFRADAESFGCGGVVITDAWFENEEHARVLTVRGGDMVKFCIKARPVANIRLPVFGFTIKNQLGQYVFSEDTDRPFRSRDLAMTERDTCLVTFSFRMPLLIQGDYFINVAVAEGAGDDHVQHHWIEDAISLRSLNSGITQGICGLQDLKMGIDIFSDNRALNA